MTYGTSVSRKSTRRVVRLGPVRTLDSPRAGGRLSEVAARRTSCCTGGKRGTAPVSWGRRLPALRFVSRPNRANDLRDFQDRKSTRLNSSHVRISYAVFCLKKNKRRPP